MPRPLKSGLDYFPMDCNVDNKIRALIGKYKATGFGVFVHLLQLIYNNGYALKATQDTIEDISIEMGVEESFISNVIDFCCRRDIFSNQAYKQKILTSHGIQKRFIEATKRRTTFNNVDKYLVNVDNNLVNASKSTQASIVNANKSTQSKVKESKEEKIYRAFNHLSITTKEIDKIKKDLNVNNEQIDSTLDNIENYKQNNKYSSLYLTCRKWMQRDIDKEEDDIPEALLKAIEHSNSTGLF